MFFYFGTNPRQPNSRTMKFLYFLTLVAIGISGYLAYDKGQLASIHPLLDPATHKAEVAEADVASVTSEESSDSEISVPEPTSGDSDKTAKPETKPEIKPDPKQVRAEQAEQRRLEAEEKKRAKEAKEAAYEADRAIYLQKKSVFEEKIIELNKQFSDVVAQIRTAEQNRYNQERAWSAQNIKNSREQDKLRAASGQFIESLVAKREAIADQITETKREMLALKKP